MQFLAFTKHLLNVLFCFNLIALIANCLPTPNQALCHDNEKSILLQFKQSFSVDQSASHEPGASPKLLSWKSQVEDCCSWDGVECNKVTGYVIGVDLSSSFLYGALNSSSSLFSLVHLRKLNLADNNFNFSQIPPEISHLSRLSLLNLSSSVFSGQIPVELAELTNLVSLDLGTNVLGTNVDHQSSRGLLKLEAPLFTSLVRKLAHLKMLHLGSVHIDSTVPEAMGNMSALTHLSLHDCGLHGEFPKNVFLASNLQVIELYSNENLTGTLPEFRDGSPLRRLDIQRTSFSGSLPASIANLTQLSFFYPCFTNLITRDLTWLGKLTKLRDLCLTDANLKEELPSSLANLTQLSFLTLSKTHLTGRIPSWLFNLTQLTHLDISYNDFHGQIKSSFSELSNLEYLGLHGNRLSGEVDANIFFNLKRLTGLNLSGNNISLLINTTINQTVPKFQLLALASCNLKEFPDFLQYQQDLEALSLAKNKIEKIPRWMRNKKTPMLGGTSGFDHFPVLPWANLSIIDLSYNNMEGSFLIPPPNIVSYYGSNNRLTGKIPAVICTFHSLFVFEVSNNRLNGTIPSCLGNSSNSLTVMNLKGNNFQGNIPQACGKGSNLQLMDLSGNQLQGPLPRSLANCEMLQILLLDNNLIEDGYPFWLGPLSNLQILILSANKLHGSVRGPKTRFEFQKLRIIDLSDNFFTGSLPQNFFMSWNGMKDLAATMAYMQLIANYNLLGTIYRGFYAYSMQITNKGVRREYEKILNIFTALDLSGNKFSGEIPDSIGSLHGLQLINISNNRMVGRIPSSIANLAQLESLDLSQNAFSGGIPNQLEQLGFLAFLNVSNNNLSGPIPQGRQFYTFLDGSYLGNSGLCGDPLTRKCISGEESRHPQPSKTDSGSELLLHGNDWIVLFSGVGSGVVVGLTFGTNLITRKHEWFVEKFGKWPKSWKSIPLLDKGIKSTRR